jgi:hypothetical protein
MRINKWIKKEGKEDNKYDYDNNSGMRVSLP